MDITLLKTQSLVRKMGWLSALTLFLNIAVSTAVFAILYPLYGGVWWYYVGLTVITVGQLADFVVALKVTYSAALDEGPSASHPRAESTKPSWLRRLWQACVVALLLIGGFGFGINAFLSNTLMLEKINLSMQVAHLIVGVTVTVAFMSGIMLAVKNLGRLYGVHRAPWIDRFGLPIRGLTALTDIFFEVLALLVQGSMLMPSMFTLHHPIFWVYAGLIVVPRLLSSMMFAMSTYLYDPEKQGSSVQKTGKTQAVPTPRQQLLVRVFKYGLLACVLISASSATLGMFTAKQLMFAKLMASPWLINGLATLCAVALFVGFICFDYTHLQRTERWLIDRLSTQIDDVVQSQRLTPPEVSPVSGKQPTQPSQLPRKHACEERQYAGR